MGKADIQYACLFWLALIEVSASNISVPLHWLKFKGSRLNNKKEHAGIWWTHTHTQKHMCICIIFPKKGFGKAYKYTQKHKMEKLKKLRSNVG